jgi:hypothetical protein
MKIRRAKPLLVALCAAGLLLAGCMTSAVPKFPFSAAVPLMGDGGRFAIHEKGDDGRFDKKEVITVSRTPDGRYLFADPNETMTFTFHRVGQLVVVQSRLEKSNRYDYSFARISGNEIHRLEFDWAAQDRDKLATLGATDMDNNGKVDGVSDMQAFVAALKFGDVEQKDRA